MFGFVAGLNSVFSLKKRWILTVSENFAVDHSAARPARPLFKQWGFEPSKTLVDVRF
jgi:hypothetical protein